MVLGGAEQEVGHHRVAVVGEDALRVELHSFDIECAVAHAHDHAVGSFGGDFEAVGKGVSFDDERVIAGCLNR